MTTREEHALASSTADAFEQRYLADEDPWHFETSPYERNRYDAILRALPRARYKRAFEPGCSVGVLTTRLATRCDEVYATEISPTALERARQRCAKQPNVHFAASDINHESPPGTFDLIVFSEIGYYFTQADLTQIIGRLAGALKSGGELIAVHWTGHSKDHMLSGDDVHQTLRKVLPFQHVTGHRHPGFQLDSWVRS